MWFVELSLCGTEDGALYRKVSIEFSEEMIAVYEFQTGRELLIIVVRRIFKYYSTSSIGEEDDLFQAKK